MCYRVVSCTSFQKRKLQLRKDCFFGVGLLSCYCDNKYCNSCYKVLDDKFFEAQIHHNLSITYSAANRSQDCPNALRKAIRNKEWRQSVFYINSLYMATKERFLMDPKDKTVYYYKKRTGKFNL